MTQAYGEIKLVNVHKMSTMQRRDLAAWLARQAQDMIADGWNYNDKFTASSSDYPIVEKKER